MDQIRSNFALFSLGFVGKQIMTSCGLECGSESLFESELERTWKKLKLRDIKHFKPCVLRESIS
jgi:hypothetical protein